ncbi:MAG: glutaredoxin 3 [Ponticaulis sp.]|nr:glutaredoxin 3 [Ponticaulis sp.]
MAKVEIYTREWCPYCTRALSLLDKKNVDYTHIDAGMDPEKRKEMIQRAQGGSTYPQIFINDDHVGGCDELHALERAGKLDALLSMDAG